MARRKLPYQAGDWFAVPLSGSGFAIGIVARMDGRGIVLGYFFGPRHASPPTLDDVRHLNLHAAIDVHFFGDLGFLDGSWTVTGRLPHWSPEDWPVPIFGRIDIVSGKRAWRVRYHDPGLTWLPDEEISVEEARKLPEDGLMGYVAMELCLDRLLGPVGTPSNASVHDNQRSWAIVPATSIPTAPAEDSDTIHAADSDQAVLVYLKLPDEHMGTEEAWRACEEIDDDLRRVVEEHGTGELDGNEIGNGYFCLYLYGPSADALTNTVRAVLQAHPVPAGSYLLQRYGEPGDEEQRIEL